MARVGRQGVRARWDETPRSVRDAVDDLLGSAVVANHSVAGGFSPGPAVRAELMDGRAVFIKAAGRSLNEDSAVMHRREGEVLAALPMTVPAPSLIGTFDDGDWVVVIIEWIDGRAPTAADGADVKRMLDLLHRLAERTTGIEIDGIDTVATTHVDLFGHWSRLAADEPVGLDAWSRVHLDRLADVDVHAVDACTGDHLVHLDVRTDNALLNDSGPDGDVLVDWPGASTGAPWIDLVTLLPSLHLDGGPPPAEVFGSTPLGRRADPDAVDAYVAALAGYFTRMSLLPPPPGLPTLRDFQAAQGVIARRWVAQRLRLGE